MKTVLVCLCGAELVLPEMQGKHDFSCTNCREVWQVCNFPQSKLRGYQYGKTVNPEPTSPRTPN